MGIKIAIADDHHLIISGLTAMLKKDRDLCVIFTASNGPALLKALEQNVPDVLLLDIQMPGMSGIDLCKVVCSNYPPVKVIALTNHEETSYVKQMMRNGAAGYLLKNTDADTLIKAIETVLHNEQYLDSQVKQAMLEEMLSGKRKKNGVLLTKREQEILALIANEFSNQEIADKLFISLRTVETHRANISQKLNTKNTAGLVKEAYSRGLI